MSFVGLLSLIPLLLSVFCLATKSLDALKRLSLAFVALYAVGLAVLTVTAYQSGFALADTAWFHADAMAVWFVVTNGIVYLAALLSIADGMNHLEDMHLTPKTARALVGLSSLFIIASNAVVCASDLGVLWVAIEATTIITAPMILLTGTRKSIEAAWKYIILCGVGLAFAMLGTLIVHVAASNANGSLSISWLQTNASTLKQTLLDTGFVFMILGYGTKAGLFPVHNWLPDAHSEAPAPASAILSGALLNLAMLAIWRVSGVVASTPSGRLLISILAPMGAITVIAAAVFLIRQQNLKRMWAYSSIENMGLLAVAAALQLAPIFALHALTHSLSKAAAFLLSGNVVRGFGTVNLNKLSGMMRRSPHLGFALLAAGVAAMGAPPFASFSSEWLLVSKVVGSGSAGFAIALVAGLAVAFVAVVTHLGRAVFGEKPEKQGEMKVCGSIVPSVVLLTLAGLLFVLLSPIVLDGLERVFAGGSR